MRKWLPTPPIAIGGVGRFTMKTAPGNHAWVPLGSRHLLWRKNKGHGQLVRGLCGENRGKLPLTSHGLLLLALLLNEPLQLLLDLLHLLLLLAHKLLLLAHQLVLLLLG